MKRRLIWIAAALAVLAAAGCAAGCSLFHRHAFGEWELTEGGCEESSVLLRECACGESERIVLPARSHIPVAVAAEQPTCTRQGATEGSVCAVCGEVLVASEAIPALGHTPVAVAAEQPTCTQQGATEGSVCAVCSEVLVASEAVPALGHSWELRAETASSHFVACTVCGVMEERAHTWQGNACTVCGFEGGGSQGLAYEEADGAVLVTGRGSCTEQVIVIPATYRGMPVRAIAERAFYRDAQLCGVVSEGEGVSVGKEAFRFCTRLQSVRLGADGDIGEYAFAGCTSLNALSLPQGTTLGLGCFYACSGLLSVLLPQGMSEVASWAFAECHALVQVAQEGDAGILTLGNYAFFRCYALERVTFLAGVRVWGDYAFCDCTSLDRIDCSPGLITYLGGGVLEGTAFFNDAANRTDGALYLGSILLSVSPQISGSYRVREGTRMLADRAFSDCTALSAVELPNSLTQMGAYAFYGCTALSAVELPAGIVRVECGTFADCTALKRVVLPAGLKVIEGYAFHSCAALEGLVLPEGLERIGDYAFEECDALTEISIPTSVTQIGVRAFFDCDALIAVYFSGTSRWHLYADELTAYYRVLLLNGWQTGSMGAYYLTYLYSDFIWNRVG